MKKQVFTQKHHKAFQEYFKVKKNPGKWDSIYIQKTKKYVPYITWIPGIKMIGIGNSISMNAGNKDSDIDLYIITDNQSMWTVRILTTLIFQLLGVRKTDKKHAGRFCLSFFSTLEGMDFSQFALPYDPYLFFWMVYFKPVYNSDNTYEKFIEINSKWCNLDDFIDTPPPLTPFVSPLCPEGCSLLRRGLGGGLNTLIKKIFLPKTLQSFEKLGKPFGVIISDDLLKFHDKDIREKIAKEI
ncbi:hypothetical protein MK079_00170 [Candidatus Gracilibacteria bacterium]|nr:hypothetical protein [Candidatus Gracilibacteria bacterium]